MELTTQEHMRRLELHTKRYDFWPGTEEPGLANVVEAVEYQALELRLHDNQGPYPEFTRLPYNETAEPSLAPVQDEETDAVVVVTG